MATEYSHHGAKTPTDLLMTVLEDFGSWEPESAVVLYIDKNNAMQVSSCELKIETIIYMLERAKLMLLL